MDKLAQIPPPEVQSAQTIFLVPSSEAFEPLVNITAQELVSFSITVAIIVAAGIFFFMLILGGLQWMTAGGDKANTEGARGRIMFALIGLLVVFSSFAIVNLISAIFGIDLFVLDIGTISSGISDAVPNWY